MFWKREYTQSDELKYYKQYPWSKCSYCTFRKRVKDWMEWGEAIKKVKLQYKPKIWRRPFYDSYTGNKCNFNDFNKKIKMLGYSFEEAIKPTTEEVRRLINPKRAKKDIKYTNRDKILHSTVWIREYWVCDIMLKPEEAKVFDRYYRKIMWELEDRISEEENYATLMEYESKLNKIKQDYNVFKSYNNISQWQQQSSH